ncbi:histidine phosphatase family protein [Alteromonas sp. CYL-A6]|uniref:histidine phosphatase family protein n=1 Tax=Alteromonas nitratireducens TaxID=3390813 RepID=UPI0034C3C400
MTEFYLVRHGQASFGKANYDALSELGHRQAAFLGEYFSQRQLAFDRLFAGNLVRHSETVAGIRSACHGLPDDEILPSLNEFEFMAVVDAYLQANPDAKPESTASAQVYYRILKQAMLAWSRNELDERQLPETWLQFEQRVGDALSDIIATQARRVLVVSSGGVIAMMLRHILGYDASRVINVNLQIKNASFSQCLATRSGLYMSSFNNIPHLDLPERQHAITYS